MFLDLSLWRSSNIMEEWQWGRAAFSQQQGTYSLLWLQMTLSVTWIKSYVGSYLAYRYLSVLEVNLFLTHVIWFTGCLLDFLYCCPCYIVLLQLKPGNSRVISQVWGQFDSSLAFMLVLLYYCSVQHILMPTYHPWFPMNFERILLQAIFKPPKAIRGGIPVCFPQVW